MIETLWKMSIYACAPILLILIARRFLKSYKTEYSYSLWILVLARLLIPVMIQSSSCIQPKLPPVRSETLTYVYLLGLCVTAGIFLMQYTGIKRRVQFAVREVKNIWRCDQIPSAFVRGLIKPKIYLPYELEGRQRWYVIKHEEMHIRHGDLWMRAIGTIVLILHWWNPLVWYGVYKMYEDVEMYCDEDVMKECASAERKLYADVLLKLSANQSGFPGLCFGESHTEQRIRNILNQKKSENIWFVILFYLIMSRCAMMLMTVPAL